MTNKSLAPFFSIIIPTLNEEKYLPALLSLIKKQTFKSYEIIVSDANSQDKTIEIAKENGCKVVVGGLPGKARNEGTKIAKGELFSFLDADILIQPDFLENILRDFKQKNLDVATFPLFFEGGIFAKIISHIYNCWVVITQPVFPHTFGAALLVRREVFEKLNGFNEEIKLAEDHDFAQRAKKISKCGIIFSTKVTVSSRRFLSDGWIKMLIKYFFIELYMVFLGPIKTDIFNYKFNHYNNKNKKNKNP